MKIDITRECPVTPSARVVQVGGMFDVSVTERSRVHIAGDLPIEDRDWNVGLIVGPSGSGKTTVARELFGDAVITGFDWPADRAMLDGFPDVGIKKITSLLSNVGFGSVPNWLRPFHVLSNGEQFRATVARAMAEPKPLVVIDEFTSVVDRQVAKIASHCVQKVVRRDARKLIAVSCHYDILDWLQPDWVYEPHVPAFEWRAVRRRPSIDLEIRTVGREVWRRFSKYHYLTSKLTPQALCLGGFINGQVVVFEAFAPFVHPQAKDIWMATRSVVLPDYQGLGLSYVVVDWAAMQFWLQGWRLHSVSAHPAVIAMKLASPRWKLVQSARRSGGSRTAQMWKHINKFSTRRVSTTFAYTPPAGTPSSPRPKREGPLFEGVKRDYGRHGGADETGTNPVREDQVAVRHWQ